MQGFVDIHVKKRQSGNEAFFFFLLLPRLSRQGQKVGKNAGRDAMHCVSTKNDDASNGCNH
jgi:hypothetical protein